MKRLEAFKFVLKSNWGNKLDVARDTTGPFINWFEYEMEGWLKCLSDLLCCLILLVVMPFVFLVGFFKGLVLSPIKVFFWGDEMRGKLK